MSYHEVVPYNAHAVAVPEFLALAHATPVPGTTQVLLCLCSVNLYTYVYQLTKARQPTVYVIDALLQTQQSIDVKGPTAAANFDVRCEKVGRLTLRD